MFTKFDKNLANYLVNNKIFNDCRNNNNNINNNNENNNNKYNDRKQMNNEENDCIADKINEENNLRNLTDEDDSVINILPDMSEIENYERISEKRGDYENVDDINRDYKDISDLNSNNLKYISNSKNQIITSLLPLSPVSSSGSSSSSIGSQSSRCTMDLNKSKQTCSFREYNANSNSSEGMASSNKKIFHRNIHCVKEKIRRDRIKFSCNELRRLIPNLNGVKTDMATLLETSVLWIQLINSNIPEQLLINVQNKLESLKLLRSNKQYLTSHQKSTSNLQMNNNQKLKSKNPSDNNGLNLKQEIFNPIQNQQSQLIQSHNSSLNSPFLSSFDPNSHSIAANPIENVTHHIPTSKPSKWLSIAQQKYSDLYYNCNTIQHDQDNLDQRCYMNSENNNYSENDMIYKATKRPIDFNNNSMYLGQVPFNDQLENQYQSPQGIPIENSETVLGNPVPSIYFQNQTQSPLTNNCLF